MFVLGSVQTFGGSGILEVVVWDVGLEEVSIFEQSAVVAASVTAWAATPLTI